MPREARKKSCTNKYHIMTRGINKAPIFNSNLEKYVYLNFFKEALKNIQINVYAYCIMPNHAHFLFEGDLNDISRIMKKTNQNFAMSYNRRHKRIGHLFQDRYKSECIEDDYYFLSVIRYIHNNPLVARLEKHICSYRWSSINEYEWSALDILTESSINNVMSNFKSHHDFMNFHEVKGSIQHLDIDQPVKNMHYDYTKANEILNCFTLPTKTMRDYINLRNHAIKTIKDETALRNCDISKMLRLSEATISTSLKNSLM